VSRQKGTVPTDPADVPTPPPVARDSAAPEPVAAVDSAPARPGVAPVAPGQRPRSQLPRERSGPIGISGGDFATPVVRRRTTTQPRGLPVVGTAAPVEAPAQTESPASDPPPPPAASNGAPPAPPPPPTAAAVDDPFVPGAVPEVDDRAAQLAAEAAAVRALDSGPITPPPEVFDPGPTPPPASQAVTGAAEPPPPTDGSPLDGEGRAQPDYPPDVVPRTDTPSQADGVAASDGEASAGAIPTSTMDSERGQVDRATVSVAASDGRAVDEEHEVASGDDLELMEGGEPGLDSLPAEALTDGGAPPATRVAPPPVGPPPLRPPQPPQSATPPPIPVSTLKTPNPELPDPERQGPAGGFPPIPGLPLLPEALAQRPRRPKRSKPWFEEVFDEDYLRTLPFMSAEQTLREVDFIQRALELQAGAEVLDVGCGYGRHAIELVHRGWNVTGLDLSLPLLIRAADEAQRRSLAVKFVHADMREMAFDKQFDGAYCMLTSFGYFDEESNLRVAEAIARSLKPGGRLLIDVVNRDYVVADLPSRVWWEGKGCVVLEEVDFNFHTSRIVTHRSIVFEDGRQIEQEISIRAYSLHELGRLLRQAGFRVTDISGALATQGQFFGTTSRNLLMLAEKRSDDA